MRPFQRGWGTNELPSLCWHVTAINPPPPNPGGRPQPGVRRVRRLPMRSHPRAGPKRRDPAQERLSIEKVRFSVGRTQPVFEQRRFVRGPGSLDRGSTPAAWKTADAPYSKLVRVGRRPAEAPARRTCGVSRTVEAWPAHPRVECNAGRRSRRSKVGAPRGVQVAFGRRSQRARFHQPADAGPFAGLCWGRSPCGPFSGGGGPTSCRHCVGT